MPSAATLRRAWLHPRKTYARPLLGQRPLLGPLAVVEASAFRPGVRFDLLDDRGNRLGWGRVTALGDIELFDAASNRLGGIRPTFRAFAGNGRTVKIFAPPIEALKEGEVLEIGPEGKRGVWRSIGGNPVFVAVRQGESVPKAIKRIQQEKEEKGQQERGAMATRAAAELSPTYEPPAGSPLRDPAIRKRAISSAEEMLSYSNVVALGLALRMRAQEMFTGTSMRPQVGIGDPKTFVDLMERKFLPPGVKTTDLIRTMYAETQQQLRKDGITSMTLYRGTNNPAVEAARRRKADPSVDVLVDMKGFASWSRSQSEASRFGGSVMTAEVPATMIWSIPSTFFEAPAFLMKSGLRIFEEEVILVPTQPLSATVGKAEKSRRRFAMKNGELNVVLDDLAEAPRPDRRLEIWLLSQALLRSDPTLDQDALKTSIKEILREGKTPAEGGAPMTDTFDG